MNIRTAGVIGLLIAVGGCTSLKSTHFHRDDSNQCWQAEKLDGYPITVKLPTHLRLTVYEKFYVAPNQRLLNLAQGARTREELQAKLAAIEGQVSTATAADTKKQLQENVHALQRDIETISDEMMKIQDDGVGQFYMPIKSETGSLLTAFDFETQLLETEKIFTVDHVRPAAGTMRFKTNLSKDQSIQKMATHSADDTIRQVSVAVQRFFMNLNGETLADVANTTVDPVADLGSRDGAKVRPVPAPVSLTKADVVGDARVKRRVVAARVFELDAPDLELQVMSFLEQAIELQCKK